MNNTLFERNYTSFIEPKYGTKRNVEHDEQMTHHIQSMHIYSIHDDERVDDNICAITFYKEIVPPEIRFWLSS
jgi:hypothetical protein